MSLDKITRSLTVALLPCPLTTIFSGSSSATVRERVWLFVSSTLDSDDIDSALALPLDKTACSLTVAPLA